MVWTQGYQLFVLCDHHLGHPLLDWGDDYHSGVVESPTSLSEDHSQLDDHTRQTTILYCRIQVKVIFTVLKDLKQLQKKSRKKSKASTGFEPMTPAIPVWCSTNWAMKLCGKQGKSEFNYEESEVIYIICTWTILYCMDCHFLCMLMSRLLHLFFLK